jgi:hypothetical protein
VRTEKGPVLFMPRTDPPGGSDGYDIAISRRVAPEVMRSAFALAKGEGAGKAGCPRHPQSCAQDAHGGPQVRRNTRLSLRDGFTAYAVISPEPNSSGLRR